MAHRLEIIELEPVGPPQRLTRPEGFIAASTAIGLRGEALRLFVGDPYADKIFAREEQPGWATFPKTRTENGYSAVLSICDPQGTRELQLSGLTATFPMVQIFPTEEILVVAPRCKKFSGGNHELNAKVYDPAGVVVAELLLGDGINHVQVDRSGNIWVGYFDEGVFGNFGWGINDCLGSAGLACFAGNGTKLWDFQPPGGFDSIADCYALNVSKDAIWLYYYADFPVARINSDWKVRAWKTTTQGARTFAVDGEKVLLYGGYGKDRAACRLLRLGADAADVVADVKLLLPSEVDLTTALVIGRDNALHVFDNDDWYSFSVESLS